MSKSIFVTLAILGLCLGNVSLEMTSVDSSQVETQPFVEFLNGFVSGAKINTEDYVPSCVQALENIQLIFLNHEEQTQKTELLSQFHQMEDECKPILTLLQNALSMTKPAFLKTMILLVPNRKSLVMDQVSIAQTAWANKEYFAAGFSLGSAVQQINPEQSESQSSETSQTSASTSTSTSSSQSTTTSSSKSASSSDSQPYKIVDLITALTIEAPNAAFEEEEETETADSGIGPGPKPPGPNDNGIPKFLWNDTNFIEGFSWEMGWSSNCENYENCIIFGEQAKNATSTFFDSIKSKAHFNVIVQNFLNLWNLVNKTYQNCDAAYNAYYYFFQPVINATLTNSTAFQTIVQNNLASHAVDSALYTAEMKSDFKEGNWYEAGIAGAKLARIGFNGYMRNASNNPGESEGLSLSAQLLPGVAYPAQFEEESNETEEQEEETESEEEEEEETEEQDILATANAEFSTVNPNIENTLGDDCQADIEWLSEMTVKVNTHIAQRAYPEFINDFWFLFAELPVAYNDCTRNNQNQEDAVFFAVQKPILAMAVEKCPADVEKLAEMLNEIRVAYEQKDKFNLSIIKTGTLLARTLYACSRIF